MKLANITNLFLVAGFMFTSTSCSDFLEEYSQDKAKVETWTDLDELLLGDGHFEPCRFSTDADSRVIYNNLNILHLMSDELKENPDTDVDLLSYRSGRFGFFTWQQDPSTDEDFRIMADDNTYWDNLYDKINTCNMVLALIDEQPADKEDDVIGKRRVKGEAYFLRAAYYFILANLYGKPYAPTTASTPAVPIKLTEYIEDKEYVCEPLETVYKQVISDLEHSIENLEGISRVSVYHPDVVAAYLLRSRVYLYMQNWTAAAQDAQEVLKRQSQLLDLRTVSAGEDAIYRDSPETIFSMGGYLIAVVFADYRSDWFGTPMYSGYLVSDDMVSLYQGSDLRRTRYIGSSERYRTRPVFMKVNGQLSAWGSYFGVSDCFLLRTPEAYLTLAEASAFAGDEPTARQALETFLATRMESAVTVTESGHALIDLIRNERAREFLLEGHRWFDLRRYTVCQPYPWSKTIEHAHNYYDNYGELLYADYYQLMPDDEAYTLPIPRKVREFQVSIGTNQRPERAAFKRENN